MAISRTWATSSAPRALALAGAILALTSACRSEPAGKNPAPGVVPATGEGASVGSTVAATDAPAAATPGSSPEPADALPSEPGAGAAADHARLAAAGDDAPLPAPGEIPAFLAPAGGASDRDSAASAAVPAPAFEGERVPAIPPANAAAAPSPAPPPGGSGDDSLDSLMRQVRLEEDGSEEEGSFASVVDADPPPSLPQPTPVPLAAPVPDAIGRLADGGAARAPEPSAEAEPCADLRARIDARMDYLRRVAVERDSFAYVENEADATALRLLAAMRRCAEHPGDEDCQAPAMEVELRDVEPPRHQFEVWPTDLEAEHKDPDDVPQDPGIRELLHQLEACRRRHTPQPLLDRHAGD